MTLVGYLKAGVLGILSFAAYRLVWELINGDQLVEELATRTHDEVSSA